MHHTSPELSHLDPLMDVRAARLLERLDAQAAEVGEPKNGWLPINTAPLDGTAILVWARWKNAPAGPAIAEWVKGRKEWKHVGEVRSIAAGIVTHWMALPQSPSE